MNALNKEILRLSIPSILANLTVPLVGMVDTALAGHLTGGSGAAAYIGAISLGSMLFNLLYWNFSFLRTGTGGLTAQAFGRRDDKGCALMLSRGLVLSIGMSLVVLALQLPFMKLGLLCVHGSPASEELASTYFRIRIWAAPATLSLMTFSGWFVGMQDSRSSMWKDFIVNGVNIAASIILTFGIGSRKGLGFAGIAWGTVIAQYSGLLYCLVKTCLKYGRNVLSRMSREDLRGIMSRSEMRAYFGMNTNLFLRSVFFTLIYIGYTMIAARYGDLMLSCSAIMMQLLMIFSYFTDGFAYAGEALTGRFIGAKDSQMLRRSVKYIFAWSMSIAALFVLIYGVGGKPLLGLLTDDAEVFGACCEFLPWLLAMPLLGCAAFTWDGVYLGATASAGIRNAMGGAAVSFFLIWFAGVFILHPQGSAAIHLLLAAYFAHLTFRTVLLTVRYRRDILSRL